MPQVGAFIVGAFGWGTGAALTGAAATAFAAGASFAGTVIGGLTVKLLTSVAITALQAALMSDPAQGGGITISTTLRGEDNPETIILGRYATAGQCVYVNSHGTSRRWLTHVVEVCSAPGATLNRLMLGDQWVTLAEAPMPGYEQYGLPVTSEDYAGGYIFVKYYDGRQTTADPMLVAQYGADPDRPWASTAIGAGLCYAVLTFYHHPEVLPQIPPYRFELDGIPLYDIRKDSTRGGAGSQRMDNPSTWAQTDNAAVIIWNVLKGVPLPGGEIWGGRFDPDFMPTSVSTLAMNRCDVPVTLSEGTEPTYRAAFEAALTQEPAATVTELLKACSGTIADMGYAWTMTVGAPALPVYAVSDDDLIISKSQTLDPFPSLADTYNAVSVRYPSPEHLWESHEAPLRTDAAAEANDVFGRRTASLSLPAAPYGDQVQRLSLAWLNDNRRFIRHIVNVPPDAAALDMVDSLDWTSDRNGYVDKTFSLYEIAEDLRTCGRQFSIRERNADDYNWTSSAELPSPPTTTVTPQVAEGVAGFDATASSVVDAGGVARRAAIEITWDSEIAAQGIRWEIRLDGQTTVQLYGDTQEVSDGIEVLTSGILPDTAYQIRARLIAERKTAWTAWLPVTTPDVRLGTDDLSDRVRTSLEAADAAFDAAELLRTDHDALVGDFVGSLPDLVNGIDYLQDELGTDRLKLVIEGQDPTLKDGLSRWSNTYIGANPATMVTASTRLFVLPGDDPAVPRGQIIQARGYGAFYSKQLFLVDTAKRYKIRARVKRNAYVAGLSRLYIGVRCLAADGVTYITVRYPAASALTQVSFPVGDYVEFVGYISGVGTAATTFPAGTEAVRLNVLLNNDSTTETGNIMSLSYISFEEDTGGLNATVNSILGVGGAALEGSKLALLLNQLQVSSATGLSAWATSQAVAVADLSGNASASYSFIVGADGVGAGLFLAAFTDAATGVPAATVQIHASQIGLFGDVFISAGDLNLNYDMRPEGVSAFSTPNGAVYSFISNTANNTQVGARYLQIAANAAEAEVWDGWFPVSPGVEHLVTATAFLSGTSGTVTVSIEFATVAGTASPVLIAGSRVAVNTRSNSAVMTQVSVEVIPPETARRARFVVTRAAGGTSAARAGGFKCSKKAGAELVIKGSIFAEHLAVDSVEARHVKAGEIRAEHLTIDGRLELNAQTASMTAGKVTPDDQADGVAFGRFGGVFGFAAARTSGGKRQEIKITPDAGLRLSNAKHVVSALTLAVPVTVTASQTIAIPAGTKRLNLALIGGGSGGAGANGAVPVASGAGGLTRVELHHNGVPTGIFWEASGGVAANAVGNSAQGYGQATVYGLGGTPGYSQYDR